MSPSNFVRLMLRHWKVLVFLPMAAAAIVLTILTFRPKEYKSSLNIYTGFGSGYTLSSSSENDKFDYYAVNNAFDNLIQIIKSDAVLQQVGLTLFAQGMIYGPQNNTNYITADSYDKLEHIVPDDVRALIDSASIEKTVAALREYMDRDTQNFVYGLIHLYHPHYSIWALENIEVKKIGSSDLIEVSYTTDDPAICYQTLDILSSNFIDSYKNLRSYETSAVEKYFADQLALSSGLLKNSEDQYMDFNKQNRVINYYEQTKAIAGQLQAFELDYDKILTANAEARRSMERLEKDIGLDATLKAESALILTKRAQIAMNTAKAATGSVFVDDSSYTRFDTDKFNRAIVDGRASIRALLDTMQFQRRTAEGIDIERVLNQWLDNAVTYDATTAAIAVLDKRRTLIDNKFDFYAPIGATVKRKEREINIYEQQYLSLLHSLALAKLRQQDINLSSESLRVTDKPLFPISAEAGKHKVMALATFFVVFLLTAIWIIFIELTDRTMRTATIVRRVSGLDVAALLPMTSDAGGDAEDDLSSRQMVSRIMHLRGERTLPLLLNLISMEPGEGKSYVANRMIRQFERLGYRVTYLNHSVDFDINSKNYNEALTPLDLVTGERARTDIVITELPAAVANPIPNGLVGAATLNLLVCRANRAWHTVDTRTVEMLRGFAPIYVLLNGVAADNMEEFAGELPKKRSAFRRFVKRALAGEFSVRGTIK